MERLIREIGSSVKIVKDLLNSLNPNKEGYLDNATLALESFDSLVDSDQDKVISDICTKYKYFDAKDAIRKQRDIENSKVVIKSLLSLDIDSKNYEKNAEVAYKEYTSLSPAETSLVLRNKAARLKLNQVKAMKVANTFLSLDSNLGTYTLDANKALSEYKNLYEQEKTLFKNNEKAYKAYNEAKLNTTKCLLMKFDLDSDNHLFIGRDALNIYEDLSDSDKNHIDSNLFYKNKIDMVNMAFDKKASDELIGKLQNLFMASRENSLTSEYFSYALRLISEYEGSTTRVKALVEAQAAFELKVAKDSKAAHPVVFLSESYLPEKKHSKYYEIADILVSAYEFTLTDRQKKYVNKSTYTMELLNEAMEDISINEKVV